MYVISSPTPTFVAWATLKVAVPPLMVIVGAPVFKSEAEVPTE